MADRESSKTHDLVVVGAGVIGCTIAWALAQAGRRVLLIDRADPATAGASFGNVGHIATEQLQPLPSPQLLLTFWRELVACGGVVDIPLRRVGTMAPWMMRFARAAFQQKAHTRHLAPLVRSAADMLHSALAAIDRGDLLKRNGHYMLWLGPKATTHAAGERARAANLGIATRQAPLELLRAAGSAAQAPPNLTNRDVAGLWFPESAHVSDPALVARAFASACALAGGSILRACVQHLRPRGPRIEIVTDTGTLLARTAVVCAGAWSAPLLAPFGIRAPLEAERGYHVELPGHEPLVDAPIIYADDDVVVTPMASRLRASSYLEFAGLDAPADPRKPLQLRSRLRRMGYECAIDGASWVGARPTLPDYMPGIGRAHGPHDLFYAVGHQHLGLTLAAVTADLIADLVHGRATRFPIDPFDLLRFGTAR